MKIINSVFVLIITAFLYANSKQIFTENKIKEFLSEENPYIYSILGKVYVYKGKLKYYLGEFDTKILGLYEKKDYPLSFSDFQKILVSQPTKKGVDILFGYRRAKGTQEFNNIKTGNQGELLLGLKFPVFSILNSIDERRVNLYRSKLDIELASLEFRQKYINLYYKILKAYYKTIYYKQILKLEKNLLQKAEKRKFFIERRIKEGLLPEVYILEANQQIINRKQRVLSAKNSYVNQLNIFLKYLNLSREVFEERYILPDFPDINFGFNLKNAIDKAFKNNPTIKYLNLRKKVLSVEKKFFTIQKYPKFDIKLYGVYDFQYNAGYKFSLQAEYPFQRRKYLGKMVEIYKSIALVNKKQEKLKIDIKIAIENIKQSLENIKQNLKIAREELKLVEELEDIEKRKFTLGASSLFLVNQRELNTLKVKKKYVKYLYDYIKLYLQYRKELSIF